MAKETTTQGGPFDVEKLRVLFELMEKHKLTEVSLRRGTEQWRFRRGPEEIAYPQAPMAYHAPPPMPVATSGGPPASASAAAAPTAVDENLLVIKSPTVGTYYASPTPEDPAFVKIGSQVGTETIVCIIEAMKVFNQIPAEVSGTIAEVLVKNGDPVEFGQPLFRVRP
ncbi:MAG: acetyl-CoA carboxylase biotin carboxyl carrier protein [Planctomycetota bacterium]|nr:acetyl-CoA carboxylase biotin carboxyl carrier protein [Planctomycetota bacterium]MDA1212206.1 acetyl-CoA carboxylase biotin carboxyl carrier protein [Planctomycetota bacterium]